MKIPNTEVQPLTPPQAHAATVPKSAEAGRAIFSSSISASSSASSTAPFTIASDSVVFSRTASLVADTLALPETNPRVSEVAKALAGGTYHVETRHVATAVLKAMLQDHANGTKL